MRAKIETFWLFCVPIAKSETIFNTLVVVVHIKI